MVDYHGKRVVIYTAEEALSFDLLIYIFKYIVSSS